MSHLPVADDLAKCEPQSQTLLKSMSNALISVASDANLIVVLIVLIVVCLLALNVNVITPDNRLAIAPFGSYP